MEGRHRGRPPAEPRWPVVVSIAAVFGLLGLLPERIRVVPAWGLYLFGAAGVLPMLAVSLGRRTAPWLRVERVVSLLFFAVMAAGTVASLAHLVLLIVRGDGAVGGLQLLTSGVGVWVNNVLMFAVLYWQLDRGGPGPRATASGASADWLWPQESAPLEDPKADWRPMFVDYLFLAFSTATAFSATDVLPLTPRAKMAMMAQSAISLATVVVVAARAINVLGG